MLKVYFNRKFSAFIAAASLAVVGFCMLGLRNIGPDFPLLPTLFLWVMVPAGLYGCIIGVRQFLHPPLMFSADRRGVTIHYDASRRKYGGTGVFLPWEIVGKLELVKVPVSQQHVAWIIRCALTAPAPFPVEEHSVVWSRSWGELTFCLDAYTGTVAMEELLERLVSLHKASSRSGCNWK